METKLYTVGKMVERIQLPPSWITGAIDELKIEPAIVLNDLAYFSVADETRIFELFRDRRANEIRNLKRPT